MNSPGPEPHDQPEADMGQQSVVRRSGSIVNVARHWFGKFGWKEFGLLAAITVVVGGIWVFVAVADEVREGEAHHFDHAIMMIFRSGGDPAQPAGPKWLPEAARDITALGSYSVVIGVTVMVIGFLLLQHLRAEALFVFVTVTGGGVLSQLLKSLFQRERPDSALQLTDVSTLSFPSGHSLLSSVVYITLGALLARTVMHRRSKIYCLWVGFLLAFLVGMTRVYLGVHFPTDVLAGWAAGASWAMLCWLAALFLQRKGQLHGPDQPRQ